MASKQVSAAPFITVDSIVHYLREDISPEVVSSTTPSTVIDPSRRTHPIKKPKKEKELANLPNGIPTNALGTIQLLPTGRVRYGPVTINPRKQPSKTLFTGRRSKYEVLAGEEEEKRRLRRDRNRVAATKCREKRDTILFNLENQYSKEERCFQELSTRIEHLRQRKQHLESLLANSPVNYPTDFEQLSTVVYPRSDLDASGFVTSTTILPSEPLQLIANNDGEFHEFLQPQLILNNSAAETDFPNYLFNSQIEQQQPQQQQQMTMTSSSLNRLLDIVVPPADLNNKTNHNSSLLKLFNSACESSTCAKQYSSSSSNEDDSMASMQQNSCVY